MIGEASVKIYGAEAMMKTLKGLGYDLRKKANKAAVTKAAACLKNKMKQLAPVDTGTLRLSIGQKVKAYGDGTYHVGIVGAISKFKKQVGKRTLQPSHYVYLLEYGHHGGKGMRPFIRPAFEATNLMIPNIMAAEIQKTINGMKKVA